jgi:hypothetical protein
MAGIWTVDLGAPEPKSRVQDPPEPCEAEKQWRDDAKHLTHREQTRSSGSD